MIYIYIYIILFFCFAFCRNVCECKNYEPNFILKRRESDCITMCKENPSENCGGGITAQNVYNTFYPGIL